MRRIIFIASLLLSIVFLMSCETQDTEILQAKNHKQTASSNKNNLSKIVAELAPFDAYPASALFPLTFRFSEPVAPFNKAHRHNFSKIKISPDKMGTWKWESDSLLSFTPKVEWAPQEKLIVDLSELEVSPEVKNKLQYKPFNIELPKAQIKLVSCAYDIKNKAPLIQSPKAIFYTNYPIRDNQITDFVKTIWTRNAEEKNLDRTIVTENNSLQLKVEGSKMFRPQSKGSIRIEVKSGLKLSHAYSLLEGATCELPYTAENWDKQQHEVANEQKEKAVVNLAVTQNPQLETGTTTYKAPLKVAFKNTWNSSFANHNKPQGITITDAFEISPKIAGTWKTDDQLTYSMVFTPSEDWPVGQLYKLNVKKDFFPDMEIKLDSVDFYAPKLTAELFNTQFYTDPLDSSKRKVLSSIRFSHVVPVQGVYSFVSAKLRVEPVKTFTGQNIKNLSLNFEVDSKDSRIIHIKSEDVLLPSEPGEVLVEVKPGILSVKGGAPLERDYFSKLTVPSSKTVFQIVQSSFTITKKPDEKMQRILAVELTEPVMDEKLQSSLEAFLLPDCTREENTQICKNQDRFQDQGAVFPETLLKSEKLTLRKVEKAEGQNPLIYFFDVDVPGGREVFLRIKKDFTSVTNFSLDQEYRSVVFVEDFPKELAIMHEGSLLSLSGSKKLGVRARNVERIEFELARIPNANAHHLVSATYGDFSKPNFSFGSFALNQLSEKFKYVESFPEMAGSETTTAVVDFTKFMTNKTPPRGLFLLTAREKFLDDNSYAPDSEYINYYGRTCDPVTDSSCYREDSEEQRMVDRRLVLVTDLALIVKDGLSGDHDVFVVSLQSGLPVSGATVRLLAQNGTPLISKDTNAEGRVVLPSSPEYKNEKAPLMYVVEKDGDYSYLPYVKEDRRMNVSRFEVSGVTNNQEAEGLRSLIFSDRGIYRPGEKASFGIIVRKRNLAFPGNVPLEISITDPRGIEILAQKIILSKLGFEDFYWDTQRALTGTYDISVNLVKSVGEVTKTRIGGTTFRVEEFQPDKLSVSARYLTHNQSGQVKSAWQSQKGDFEVQVNNLFGTPAQKNKVKGRMQVKPWDGNFESHKGFIFYAQSQNNSLPLEPEDLGETETNEKGVATFKTPFDRYSERAFTVEFAGEAFEKDSGRSVISTTKALISNEPYFVGYKADGSLSYISKSQRRILTLLAVDNQEQAKNDINVKFELSRIRMISALVKKPNGSFGYEMSPKKEFVKEENVLIDSKGKDIELLTADAGKYVVSIFSTDGVLLNTLEYQVHGDGDTNFMTDKTSELGLVLSKQTLVPEEELEISINSPFVGSGLITIERDRVYTSKWFVLEGLSTTQKIKIPKEVVGNAYVSVMVIRSQDSKDIFASPLSYGVKPITISKSQYTADVALHTPAHVLPGTDLEVSYQLSKPGRLLVYAVDEGILQFARYKNPEPVSQFIPKRGLEVETFQILDQILPDYKIVESLSSPGGDEDVGLGKFKNPFSRKKRPPMTFWSGVINEEKTAGVIKIPIPEYYNGTLRILAVLVTDTQVGASNLTTIVRDDYVIEPQAPLAVSPGDEFEIGATIAHGGQDRSGVKDLDVIVSGSEGLQLLDNGKVNIKLNAGSDTSLRFKVRAGEILGSAGFSFEVKELDKKNSRVYKAQESISIRPASVVRTEIRSGLIPTAQENKKDLTLERVLYPEQREVSASISYSPIALARSYMEYLKNYPYGCTEQVVSIAFPGTILGSNVDLGLLPEYVDKFQDAAFKALSSRQRYQGDFGLWDIQSESDLLFSIYAMHFILEARDKGARVPSNVLEQGLRFIKNVSKSEYYTMYEQLALSYALYLRARNAEVVSSELNQFVSQLERQWGDQWKNTAISLFVAATYKIMKLDSDAERLFTPLPEVWSAVGEWPLSSPQFHGAVYAWLASKHFEESKWPHIEEMLNSFNQALGAKSYNTFESVFSILAIDAISQRISENNKETLEIFVNSDAMKKEKLTLSGDKILSSNLPLSARSVTFERSSNRTVYYQLNETGYDKESPKPFAQGLSVKRELKNKVGDLVSQFSINEAIEVTLYIEAEKDLSRMAIVDLLPGGVEIDLSQDSIAKRESLYKDENTWKPNAIDIQEDRLIFFGNLKKGTNTFSFKLKPLSAGTYAYPAPFAEAMYDINTKFLGEAQRIVIAK